MLVLVNACPGLGSHAWRRAKGYKMIRLLSVSNYPFVPGDGRGEHCSWI